MNPTTLHSTTIGDHLHRIARAIVPLVAFAYVAGYALGDWVHWLNDRLAGRGRERWAAPARPRPVALLQPAADRPLPTSPAPDAPVFEPIPGRGLFTVPQLRRMARERGLSRKLYTYGRRDELIEALNQ
jgi:hypothetical protein